VGEFDQALQWWRLRRDEIVAHLKALEAEHFRPLDRNDNITEKWVGELKQQIKEVEDLIADCERRNT
jgi:hypothetical protein